MEKHLPIHLQELIIPAVYRDDYLLSLRKLTRHREADAYIRMLIRIHEFSATITGDNMDEMQNILEKANAFLEANDGKLSFIQA